MTVPFNSEGSELYVSLNGINLVVFDCPIGVTGLGFTASERESPCLNEVVGKSRPGKRKLNSFQVPFRLVAGSSTHRYMLSLSEPTVANKEIPYGIGWSDGTANLTIAATLVDAPRAGTPVGTVASAAVTAGGTGYTSAPVVAFTGGGGTGATAIAVLTGTVVTSIVVTEAGSGYTTVPTVALTGGAGTGATATATLSALLAPPTRTATVGSMFVSSVSFDFADGADVMGSFTAMPQSQRTWHKPL